MDKIEEEEEKKCRRDLSFPLYGTIFLSRGLNKSAGDFLTAKRAVCIVFSTAVTLHVVLMIEIGDVLITK